MNFQKLFNYRIVLSGLMLTAFSAIGMAQSPSMKMESDKPWSVAVGNNLYCAGYIQSSAISDGNKIIGALDEADKYNFGQNDFLFS